MRMSVVAWGVAFATVVWPALGLAQAPEQQRTPAPQQARPGPAASAAAAFESSNPEELSRAIRALGTDPRADVRPLVARIRNGLPSTLVIEAVEALAQSRRPEAGRALVELARHRRGAVRVKVAEALIPARAPGAERLLSAMLDDPSREVRAAAATALGLGNARAAMPQLVAAARRGQAEAQAVVAAHAGPSDVARMLREVEAASLDTWGAILKTLATRTELARPARLQIVAKLRTIGGPPASRILQEIVNALPENDAVRGAAAEALDATQASQEGQGEAQPARPRGREQRPATPAATPPPATPPATPQPQASAPPQAPARGGAR